MLEALIKRDRLVVLSGLVLVAALSWAYLFSGAGMTVGMARSTETAMGIVNENTGWSPGYFGLMLVMWWVMMVAMMLPSAAPMILLFATFSRATAIPGNPKVVGVPVFIFAAGYLLIWGGFSLLATLAQWGLTSARLLDPMMYSNSILFGALLLITAGAYQFTPIKDACLRHCQSPVQFVVSHWMPGRIGALRMGLQHGIFCLGCCWFMMALLFYGGVMNIAWIGGLAIYVLLEKLTPPGHVFGKITGVALIGWGVVLLWQFGTG